MWVQVVVALAALVGTATGYGFVVLSGPPLALLLPPHDVVPLTVALGWVLVTALLATPAIRGAIDRAIVLRICIPGALGIPVGVWLLRTMDPATLRIVLGLVSAALALAGLASVTLPVKHPLTVYATGFVCGVLSGSVGLAGPPLVLYLTAAGTAKATFRGTAAAVNWLLASLTLAQLAFARQIPTRLAGTTLLLLPALAVGGALGLIIFPLLTARRFRQVALLLAAVSGLLAATASLLT